MPKDPRFEAHLAADFAAGPSAPVDHGVFRILIFGDFAGRRDAPGAPVEQARVWRVDRDDVDSVLSQIAPELHLTLDTAASPSTLRFSSIEDFHPDRLRERVAGLSSPPDLSVTSGGSASLPSSGPSDVSPASAASAFTGSLLDHIVDRSDAPARQVAPRDDLAAFVDRAVRAHVVQEPTREQRELTAKVDDVISATVRALLHHPDFRALEALWRGVDFLVRRLETGETLQVVLVDVSRDALEEDLISGGEGAATRAIVRGAGASLVVGTYTFGRGDVSLLSRVAAVGRATNAPWIVGGQSSLVGSPSFATHHDPDDWDQAAPDGWEALRASADASFLGIALPRFLLRVPYGKTTDPCDVPFEEMPTSPPPHEHLLWGNSALLCALAIGTSVADGEALATQASIGGMPLYFMNVDSEVIAVPCVEAVITHDAVARMLDRGLTPLACPRDGDDVLIRRLQSVQQPPRALSISRASV